MSTDAAESVVAFACASLLINPKLSGFATRVARFEADRPVWALAMSAERFDACPVALVVVEREKMPQVTVVDLALPVTIVQEREGLAALLKTPEVMAACTSSLETGFVPVVICAGENLDLSFGTGPVLTISGRERVSG